MTTDLFNLAGKIALVTGAILFLASPASGFATGSILPVDGGCLI